MLLDPACFLLSLAVSALSFFRQDDVRGSLWVVGSGGSARQVLGCL